MAGGENAPRTPPRPTERDVSPAVTVACATST